MLTLTQLRHWKRLFSGRQVQESRRCSTHFRATHKKASVALCTWTGESETCVSWVMSNFHFLSLSFRINDTILINLCHYNFISADEFKKSTSYITQDDSLQLLLTVAENMKIAADLKLGEFVSESEKIGRVSVWLGKFKGRGNENFEGNLSRIIIDIIK